MIIKVNDKMMNYYYIIMMLGKDYHFVTVCEYLCSIKVNCADCLN